VNLIPANLRPAVVADIPCMMELERACPSTAHWTEQQYRQAVGEDTEDPARLVLAAEAGSPAVAERKSSPDARILGFLVARRLASEWELENIVVAPAARRMGVGQRLLDALLAEASHTDNASVFLEVRESNVPARKLYEKMGFEQTGRRKSYYADPAEDAILYTRSGG